jgi:predicted enzyme related to lactoylglutathione lyase
VVKGLAFVAYAVRDASRAAAFYRDVVGLKLEETFNEEYVEFDLGTTAFAVDGSPPPGCEPGTCSGVNFEVDDIAAARERISGSGAEVSEIHEFPACWVCFATDPDGNRFALHKRKI